MNDRTFVIGVDIGGTNTKIGVVSENGEIIFKNQIPTDSRLGKARCVDRICQCVSKVIKKAEGAGISIKGIGLGVTGQVDIHSGTIVGGIKGKISGWIGLPIGNLFRERFNLPVFVDNDGNVAALGEYIFGFKKSVNSIVALTIGTGVGSGIILDGKLFRGGGSNLSGELGHISINYLGPLCNCGNKGCLEAYVSKEAILDMFVKKMEKEALSNTIKPTNKKSSSITPELIYKKHLEGERAATEVIYEVGRYIGYAMTVAVNTIGPQVIVIGGGIAAQFGGPLIEEIRATVKSNAFGLAAQNVKIILTKFGPFAGVLGASTLALNKYKGITGM